MQLSEIYFILLEDVMKRLILSSLLGCILVGQISAADQTSDNSKLGKGIVMGVGMTGTGTTLGLTLAYTLNGFCNDDLQRGLLWAGLPVIGALTGSIAGIVYAKKNVIDASEQKGIIIGSIATPLVSGAMLFKIGSALADFIPQFKK